MGWLVEYIQGLSAFPEIKSAQIFKFFVNIANYPFSYLTMCDIIYRLTLIEERETY